MEGQTEEKYFLIFYKWMLEVSRKGDSYTYWDFFKLSEVSHCSDLKYKNYA